MIINELKIVDNGVREAGILILGVINHFKVDDSSDISVNDRLGIDEDCVKPCENGFLYAMFDVDVSEYNYVDAFLPWKMYETIVPESASVYPIEFNLSETYDPLEGDYWGLDVPENCDKGDYFIKTNQGEGFGKVLTINHYIDNRSQPCEKEDAVGTYFNSDGGIS